MARKPGLTPPAPLANGADENAERPETTIEIIDDTETGAEVPDHAAAAGTGAVGQPDPSIADLQRQLDAERAKAATDRAELDRLRNERMRDQTAIQDSRLLVIDTTITAKETEKSAILRELTEAKEAGDYAAEAAAMDKLSMVNIDLKQAKLGKERIESEIESRSDAPATEDARLEAWFEETRMGEPSRQWLRSHKEFLSDPVKNAELTRAHHLALRAGHAANTPTYFEHVEQQLGLREAPQEELNNPNPTPPAREAPAPAAPVSRTAGVGAGYQATGVPGILQSGNKFRVTNDAHGQRIKEAAQIAGISLASYVENALQIQREKLN